MKVIRAFRTAVVAAAVGGAALGLAANADAEFFGDPAGAADFWVLQSGDDCALMATADVIGELTGHQPSEAEIIDAAMHTPSRIRDGQPIYLPPPDPNDPDSGQGTNIFDLPVLLEHYGVHATATNEDDVPAGQTNLDVLEKALDGGHRIIVSVNAETIWNQDGDRTHGDHAVVVTGLDTDDGVVMLNDSGTEDGADEVVPMDVFESAWAAGYHAVVVTTEAA
ncbi:C39 family peptidase [Mycobacterium sp. WMMD1722]|uniref:C39 family peptidase n=1 Tax=Mycobacterium sp. WMMD1722 TaxID=3404117 RepID=UPI003BF4DA91